MRSPIAIMEDMNKLIQEANEQDLPLIDDENPTFDRLGFLYYKKDTDEIRFTTENL